MSTPSPAAVLTAMTRRDGAAYSEQRHLAVARRLEARGEAAAAEAQRASARAAGAERAAALEEAARLFGEWAAAEEPPHAV